ncbi:MAG: CvpA family protein [Planctomycetes bacterium]|nr:CvpA family protein [Planctomycetota bacterium]
MPAQESASGLLDDAVADLGAAAHGLGLIDGICLGLIAVFALRGFFRGFVRQAALFAAIFGGISLANLFAEPLSNEIPDLTSALESGDRLFAAYVAIFLATLLLAALVARFLEQTLELLQLRSVDRLLGFALGAACGTLLVAFLLACGLVFTPRVGPGERIHRSLEDSRSLRLVANGVVHLRLALPHPFLVHAEEILENHAQERAAAASPPSPRSEAADTVPPDGPRGALGDHTETRTRQGSTSPRSQLEPGTSSESRATSELRAPAELSNPSAQRDPSVLSPPPEARGEPGSWSPTQLPTKRSTKNPRPKRE